MYILQCSSRSLAGVGASFRGPHWELTVLLQIPSWWGLLPLQEPYSLLLALWASDFRAETIPTAFWLIERRLLGAAK